VLEDVSGCFCDCRPEDDEGELIATASHIFNYAPEHRPFDCLHDTSSPDPDSCITGGISSKFSRTEASCLENCVDRFLDSSLYIVKQIESQKQAL
jgi:hypothetical protein